MLFRSGSWAIDDKRYYIKVNTGTAQVRTVGELRELIIPVGTEPVSYSIIW